MHLAGGWPRAPLPPQLLTDLMHDSEVPFCELHNAPLTRKEIYAMTEGVVTGVESCPMGAMSGE